MPRYYCDYCDNYLTHDSPSVRKQHNSGFKHKANVRAYFLQFEQQQTEDILEQKMAANMALMAKMSGPGFGGNPNPGAPLNMRAPQSMPPAGFRPPTALAPPPMNMPPPGYGRGPPGMGAPGGMPPPQRGMPPPPGMMSRPAYGY